MTTKRKTTPKTVKPTPLAIEETGAVAIDREMMTDSILHWYGITVSVLNELDNHIQDVCHAIDRNPMLARIVKPASVRELAHAIQEAWQRASDCAPTILNLPTMRALRGAV
jgi:hypothetical protein